MAEQNDMNRTNDINNINDKEIADFGEYDKMDVYSGKRSYNTAFNEFVEKNGKQIPRYLFEKYGHLQYNMTVQEEDAYFAREDISDEEQYYYYNYYLDIDDIDLEQLSIK